MNAICRIAIVLAVGIGWLPGAARGQRAAPPPASAASAGVPEPLTGVGPGRSGRAAGAVSPEPAAITAAATAAPGPALSVTGAMAAAGAPEPVDPVNVRLLDRDVTAKFVSLNCRTDVARRKLVPPRLTIAGLGQGAVMDVVGSTPVDSGVLDCLKRDANIWLLAAPAGGDVRLNRSLVFRRLSPAAPRP
jgi:hypothetical protein